MKKIIISSVFLMAGVVLAIGIIISAVMSLPELSAWDSSCISRLWFVIFAGNRNGLSGLGLGLFFILGIVMMIFGIVGLVREYARKET